MINQEQLLADYVSGKINLHPYINVIDPDTLSKIGKEMMDKILEKGIEHFPYAAYDIEQLQKSSLKNLLSFNQHNKPYYKVCIYTISALEVEEVEKIFQCKGIYHSEFGEGFYDDESHEKISSEDCYSMFLEIDSVKFHICIDHRGSSIEIEKNFHSKAAFEIFCNKIVDLK